MTRRFTFTHPKQRELFLSFVDTFTRAADALRTELAKDAPDLTVLDQACGSIQHDLNTLRHGCAMQLAASPYREPERT